MALPRIFLCPIFIILFTGSLRVHGLQERARIPNRRRYSSSPTVIRGDQPPQPDPDEFTSKPINRRPLIATINSTSQHPLSTKLMSSYTNQSRGYTPTMLHPCEQSSCYPATGNLLIGRESRLHASSTCGLNGQERYCIVSHLEDRKKCFWCHTNQHTENNPHLNHAIKNIVYRNHPGTRTRSWWQSENGKENVTIQLDMEAEFHFTHLIIVFKTFRPAAMLIERSYDFGKTWQVYRYFAHNCEESFPGVPKHVFRALTDVVCESRYSNVAPSSEGEIIFRVLPPTLQIDDPYSLQVQNLLKMTNLRINFTKLHTLGDDLLDNRDEIQEKYYYAISDMVVRGSCSCYGHASRCLPLPGVVAKTDMVHGRCECTHNTKGLNCEVCEDFFNDLPWKPAINKQTNACRRCSCNNHATSCHFDPAVFESTGRISGGVCDGCQHNTMGRNCEQCKQFFYQDPEVDIQSAEVCKPCDCDPRGSLDNGICDSVTDIVNNLEAGRCTCKRNVDGRRCDNCKIGFWNFEEDNPEGCETCTCNTFGTVDNQGCNLYTGECTCKRYVTGRDCNQCLPEHWGLSDDRDGCQACDCDLGGSLDNHCDVITGQCKCREHVQGRTCSTPIQHFYIGSLDALTYEAELAKCTDNCQIVIREPYRDGRNNTWTGPGFMRSFENSEIEFTIDDIYTTMEYDIVVRYEPQLPGEWEDVTLVVERQSPVDPNSACWNSIPKDDSKRAALSHTSRNSKVFPPACLEARKTYKVKLHFNRHNSLVDNPSASILIDSIVLVPKIDAIPFFVESSPQAENMREEYERNRCSQSYYDVQKSQTPEVCKKYQNSIGFYVFNGAFSCQCDPTGSISKICSEYSGTCQCKPNVVGRRCDRCAPGTYGFGPDGCKACDCNSIGSLDNFCEDLTGQCKCRPNTYGRECDQCQPGFWNFPNCQRCECNGHADICQPKTGACIECRDYTVGQRCEICVEGHYGNPILGRDIPCRPCPCPGTVDSGHSYADRCNLDPYTEDVVCECQNGYAGSRCDVCADNYYGHPDVPGGRCFPCDCNNNTHISLPGNCDPQTGRCIKCQFNTEGDHCGICKAGYYGDATQKLCTECVCNVLGTDGNIIHCDRQTGQCPCLRNVIGLECDQCRKNYWKIASGEGCEACDCDPIGSEAEQCNEFDGQCVCKPGFGGRQCDQCQTNHWGNPNIECHACKCDRTGSLTLQCHRENGTCICDTGIGGDKCDKCARGYLGHAPQCAACGECFENWDTVLIGLQGQTNRIIEDASKIKTKGATGAYAREFDTMEKQLGDVKDVLANTEVSTNDVDDLEDYVSTLRQNLNISTHSLQDVENGLESTGQEIKLAKVALEDLRDKGSTLRALAGELKGNATKLQEANVEGALNLTQDAKQRALLAEDNALRTQDITAEAERNCKRTEGLINRAAENYNELTQENENDLKTLQNKLRDLEKAMPLLNKKVCDKEGDPCDSLCGGAGCGVCGGLSCEEGSVNKAEKALEFAKATDKKIKDHEAELDSLLRSMSQAKQDTIDAYQKALEAYNIAINARNTSDALIKSGSDVVKELKENLSGNHSTPSEVRALATETLAMNIQLKPEQIENLGQKITETVDQLTDINKIIQETAEDLANVNELKTQAHEAKEHAENILNKTTKVVAALNDAENAQKEASSAIVQANNDIDAARRDLTEIGRETVGAQEKASETAKKVNELQTRLRTVQNNFYGNDHESKVVKAEAEALITQTEQALTTASDLRNKYREADLSLTEKVKQSANAREKASTLLERANKLSVETTDKLMQLKGMEEAYNNNTQSFLDLNGIIDSLMKKMENYLSGINQKSEYYRTCT